MRPECPSVRLAHAGQPEALIAGLAPAPTIRLAHTDDAQGTGTLTGRKGRHEVPKIPERIAPALLVSYVYLEPFLKSQSRYCYRDWMMDSGAYSAYNSGQVIDLQAYIDKCHELLASDPTLVEIIALDVIGSAKGSLANSLKMKEAGLEVIPVFHVGEDYGILSEYCEAFQKVGLSCRFGEPLAVSLKFYDQCFARQWPKKFHSFGWISEAMLMRYPFHSGDSSSWEAGPCAFGNWKSFGKMSVRGSKQNLRAEIEWYLKLEERLRVRWKKQMQELEEKCGPTVRLAAMAHERYKGQKEQALNPPAIRLAADAGAGGGMRIQQSIGKE